MPRTGITKKVFIVLLIVFITNTNLVLTYPTMVVTPLKRIKNLIRAKRQFDFTLSADHEEKVGTDLMVEAIAKLWRSQDGRTNVDGTAKVIHHSGQFSSQGNTKYSASLHVHHDYRQVINAY